MMLLPAAHRVMSERRGLPTAIAPDSMLQRRLGGDVFAAPLGDPLQDGRVVTAEPFILILLLLLIGLLGVVVVIVLTIESSPVQRALSESVLAVDNANVQGRPEARPCVRRREHECLHFPRGDAHGAYGMVTRVRNVQRRRQLKHSETAWAVEPCRFPGAVAEASFPEDAAERHDLVGCHADPEDCVLRGVRYVRVLARCDDARSTDDARGLASISLPLEDRHVPGHVHRLCVLRVCVEQLRKLGGRDVLEHAV
mmetsp:Transcript_75760/g.214375  ORF Transcript_75760/g.214375 Transcript_75760/m.214375 type:complete len:254 (-) Transcript_75760:228-989(-)